MAINSEREYRAAQEFRALDDDNAFIVDGYASTFEPYVLFNDGETEYSERIDRNAFDGCDMSDVIFLYNHEGMVYARQRNGSLTLNVDDHGLHVRADLGGTEESRKIYDAIKAGLIDQMSFAFTVKEDAYDKETHTRTITQFKKLYDVSAVSVPANPQTTISARSWCNGVIDHERTERFAAEERARKVRILKLKLECYKE